jgi:hypothetical protein
MLQNRLRAEKDNGGILILFAPLLPSLNSAGDKETIGFQGEPQFNNLIKKFLQTDAPPDAMLASNPWHSITVGNI